MFFRNVDLFLFRNFLSLCICSIFSKDHAKILFESDDSLLPISCREIIIQMSEMMVTRWLKSAMENMIQNKEIEIRCPQNMIQIFTQLMLFHNFLLP
jgi:hypothetical protein